VTCCALKGMQMKFEDLFLKILKLG